jgi:hypothetical protein
MQFIIDNDLYKIARITGPNHNFLAIRLSEKNVTQKPHHYLSNRVTLKD